MAMANLPNPIPLWDITSDYYGPALVATGFVIDAASEKAGHIIQAPKTGNISKVGFYVAAHTTGATLDVRLETVSGTTGMPTGTLFGTNTSGTVATTATGWYECTLTAAAAVSKGDRIALVVAQPSTSSGNCAIGDHSWFYPGQSNNFPKGANYVSSWAIQASLRRPVIYPVYDDNTYGFIPKNLPITAISTSFTLSTSTTPDEVGNRFVLDVPTRVAGARLYMNPGGDAKDFTLKIYDNSNTVVATETFDSSLFASGYGMWMDVFFDAAVDLVAGTYRITVLPTTTSSMTIIHCTMPSATGVRSAMPGGENTYWTERTDAGAWTDTNTRFMGLTPLASGFDDGAGAGGLAANPIRGFVV